jgi:hypothetical protein
MYFVDPFGWFGGGGASSDMLAWMPADTQSVQGIDFDQVNKYPKALNSTRSEIRDAEAIGIKAEDVSSSMQAKKTSKNANEVTVIKLKAPADKDKISKAAGGQEATAIGKKYYKTNGGGALYFASDKIVVITRSESTMTDLLANDGKVVISKDLQDVIKKADGHIWMAGIGSDANIFGGGDMGDMGKAGFPGITPPPPPKSGVMNAKFTSDEVTIKAELTFADAESAKRAKESIEGMFNMFKGLAAAFGGKGGNDKKSQDMKKMFDSFKVSQSGSTVTITMTGPIDAAEGFKGGGFGGR